MEFTRLQDRLRNTAISFPTIAKSAGVSRTTLWKWRSGKITQANQILVQQVMRIMDQLEYQKPAA